MIIVDCPCGIRLQVPNEAQGRTIRCKRCSRHHFVNSNDAAARQAAPPPLAQSVEARAGPRKSWFRRATWAGGVTVVVVAALWLAGSTAPQLSNDEPRVGLNRATSSADALGLSPSPDTCEVVEDLSLLPRTSDELRPPRHAGYGRLTVFNGTGRDAVVTLVNAPDRTPHRTMFIAASEEGVFTSVRAGSYRLQYMMGEDINPANWRFCRNASYHEADEDLVFRSPTYDDPRYNVYELTLHKVADGNLHMLDLDAADVVFPEP